MMILVAVLVFGILGGGLLAVKKVNEDETI
jgi:hypothetical protein